MNTEHLHVHSAMTIYQAADLKILLQTRLAEVSALSIDLSQVSEIDTTGLQLLLALRAEKKPVTLVNPNQCVKQLAELLQLNELLDFKIQTGATL